MQLPLLALQDISLTFGIGAAAIRRGSDRGGW